jgi:hypothetical protein
MQALGGVPNQIAVVLHQHVAGLLVSGFMEVRPYLIDIELLVSLHNIPP